MKRVKIPRPGSPGEEMAAIILRSLRIPFVREFQFHPERKWRFDFLLPDKWVIEVEGGTRMKKSGHSTHAGITRDIEKYNAAVLMGFRVLRYTSEMVKAGCIERDMSALGISRQPVGTKLPQELSVSGSATGENAASSRLIRKTCASGDKMRYWYVFQDRERVLKDIQDCFDERSRSGKRISIAHLARELGCDRKTIYYHYERDKEAWNILQPLFARCKNK